jgi:hypothetical protein
MSWNVSTTAQRNTTLRQTKQIQKETNSLPNLIKNNIPLQTHSLNPDNRQFEYLFSLISGLDILIIKIYKPSVTSEETRDSRLLTQKG